MSRCHDITLFASPPPPTLCCPFDGGVLRDAIKSVACGHVFGMRCALDYLLDNESCPVCGIALDITCLAPVQHVRDAVSALHVRCPEERCSWIGPLAQVASHVGSSECAVKRIACPFCHGIFEDGAPFEDHKPVCPEFIAICPKCESDMPRRLYALHEASCTVVPRKIPRLSQLRESPSKQHEASPPKAEPSPSPQPSHSSPTAAPAAEKSDPGANAAAAPPPSSEQNGNEASSSSTGPMSPQSNTANTMGIGVARTTQQSGDDNDEMLRSLSSAAASPAPSNHPTTESPAPAQDAAPSGSGRSPSQTAGRPPRVPTPPTTVRSPSPNSAPAAAAGQRSSVTVACPFAHVGCDAAHTGPASDGDPCQTAAVLARHLALVCASLTTLQSRHDKLELQVEALKTQEMRRTRGAMNSTLFSHNASRLNTSTGSNQGQRTSQSVASKSPRDQVSRTPNDKSLAAKRSNPPIAPLNLGVVQSGGGDQGPKSATASPNRRSEFQPQPRPVGSAQPLTRSSTTLAPVIPAGSSAGRHVAGGTVRSTSSNPPVARAPAVVAPVTAWKAPPDHEPTAESHAAVGPSAVQLKKTSAAARTAAKELLELRSGAGGIAYKDLVSVLPSRSPAKASSPQKTTEERKPPRVIPPVFP